MLKMFLWLLVAKISRSNKVYSFTFQFSNFSQSLPFLLGVKDFISTLYWSLFHFLKPKRAMKSIWKGNWTNCCYKSNSCCISINDVTYYMAPLQVATELNHNLVTQTEPYLGMNSHVLFKKHIRQYIYGKLTERYSWVYVLNSGEKLT